MHGQEFQKHTFDNKSNKIYEEVKIGEKKFRLEAEKRYKTLISASNTISSITRGCILEFWKELWIYLEN